eukprot:TRINITY_DN9784_c0_g1_i1.p1 TRINITY_DN9784_c0_g1~~TRINITY_DN9784_c0_g1_i1.p1  ORF type:complete len:473 (+),score=136.08 TRINITY_DN9784_c0_g1_i1:99-1517(+)
MRVLLATLLGATVAAGHWFSCDPSLGAHSADRAAEAAARCVQQSLQSSGYQQPAQVLQGSLCGKVKDCTSEMQTLASCAGQHDPAAQFAMILQLQGCTDMPSLLKFSQKQTTGGCGQSVQRAAACLSGGPFTVPEAEERFMCEEYAKVASCFTGLDTAMACDRQVPWFLAQAVHDIPAVCSSVLSMPALAPAPAPPLQDCSNPPGPHQIIQCMNQFGLSFDQPVLMQKICAFFQKFGPCMEDVAAATVQGPPGSLCNTLGLPARMQRQVISAVTHNVDSYPEGCRDYSSQLDARVIQRHAAAVVTLGAAAQRMGRGGGQLPSCRSREKRALSCLSSNGLSVDLLRQHVAALVCSVVQQLGQCYWMAVGDAMCKLQSAEPQQDGPSLQLLAWTVLDGLPARCSASADAAVNAKVVQRAQPLPADSSASNTESSRGLMVAAAAAAAAVAAAMLSFRARSAAPVDTVQGTDYGTV